MYKFPGTSCTSMSRNIASKQEGRNGGRAAFGHTSSRRHLSIRRSWQNIGAQRSFWKALVWWGQVPPRTITYECSFRWENDNVQTLLMNKFHRIIAFTPPFITFPSLLASREVRQGKRIPLCEGEKDGSYRDKFLTPFVPLHILIFN